MQDKCSWKFVGITVNNLFLQKHPFEVEYDFIFITNVPANNNRKYPFCSISLVLVNNLF